MVRVTAVGICGSDVHWYDEARIGDAAIGSPIVPGHEIAGIIETGPRAGERVVLDPAIPCGRCALCLEGRGRLCTDLRFAGMPPDEGGMQSWLAWPSARCIGLPAPVPDHEAPLLEIAGIALHAADLAGIRPGLVAGVYGSGPVGQVLVRTLRMLGVTEIVATDRLAHRVRDALASGASRGIVVPPDGPDPAASEPVDVAFECAGDDTAVDTAIRAVRPGGDVLLVGIPTGDTTRFTASVARRKELRIVNVRRMEDGDLARAAALAGSGALRLDGLVTDRYPLEAAATAFETASARTGMKVIVEP